MVDELWRSRIANVIDSEAAVAIGLLFRRLDCSEICLGNAEFLRQFDAGWFAAKRLAQLPSYARQLLGTSADRRRLALVVHHHQTAGKTHLVAVRGAIV